MRAEKAEFGAERSGHYYFKNFFGLDSGILAAIQTINAVSHLPYKLSDFVEFLPKYYHQEIDIKLSEQFSSESQQEEILKKVESYYKLKVKKSISYKLKAKSYLDGLTMEFNDWWFNLRFSKTEPLARLNIETAEKSKFQKESNRIKKFLK
jgi:phosphomannomutase